MRMLLVYRPVAQSRPIAVRAFLRVRSMDRSDHRCDSGELPSSCAATRSASRDRFMQTPVDEGLAAPRFNRRRAGGAAAFSFPGRASVSMASSHRPLSTAPARSEFAWPSAPRRAPCCSTCRVEAVSVISWARSPAIGGAFATTRMLESMPSDRARRIHSCSRAARLVLVGRGGWCIVHFGAARGAARPVIACRSE